MLNLFLSFSMAFAQLTGTGLQNPNDPTNQGTFSLLITPVPTVNNNGPNGQARLPSASTFGNGVSGDPSSIMQVAPGMNAIPLGAPNPNFNTAPQVNPVAPNPGGNTVIP